jgi:hypothetical protein
VSGGLNGLFAFVQEERAEHAVERLRDLLQRRVTVVHDGAQHHHHEDRHAELGHPGQEAGPPATQKQQGE